MMASRGSSKGRTRGSRAGSLEGTVSRARSVVPRRARPRRSRRVRGVDDSEEAGGLS